ncbi:peptidylprolyl isomerase [Candidatus Pelagibacter sp.]|uniref:peptidylprolyl isomerase n=1 Tax=Candidatus Pelagibacter sp. TaxID=2024849 RepID=UPI003F852873
MIRLLIILLIILNIFVSNNTQALQNQIILKVGNEIITSLDIQEEYRYLISLNRELENIGEEQIIQIAKNSLIREKIKRKEILNYVEKIEIEKKFLDPLVKNVYLRLNMKSLDELKAHLKNYNIDFNNFKEKIIIEALWNDLVFSKYSSKVQIDLNKIRKDIQKNNREKIKNYNLSEIVFDIKENENYENKLSIIKNEIDKIGFENAAVKYSISDSAKASGNLGWIKETSVSDTILKEISKIKTNEYTNPVTIPGGFIILKLKDIKIEEKKIDIEKEIETIANAKRNEQLNQFSNIYYKKVEKEFIINEL